MVEKPSNPIINRKGGVCGTGVPCVCTFSTAVEDAVEKSDVSPAKRRAWRGEKAVRSACNKRKSMDFPGFYASSPCDKRPQPRIEWLSLFGMLGSHPSRKAPVCRRARPHSVRSIRMRFPAAARAGPSGFVAGTGGWLNESGQDARGPSRRFLAHRSARRRVCHA